MIVVCQYCNNPIERKGGNKLKNYTCKFCKEDKIDERVKKIMTQKSPIKCDNCGELTFYYECDEKAKCYCETCIINNDINKEVKPCPY